MLYDIHHFSTSIKILFEERDCNVNVSKILESGTMSKKKEQILSRSMN